MLTKEEFLKKYGGSSPKYPYMLLSRMQSDCTYIIDTCNCDKGAHKFLWASEGAEAHITYMKYLWESLAEKPVWLTMEQINEYAKKLIGGDEK